ncbi:MAG: tetratricopeptide repeat protein [Pyrinomonadaceae bacterium]
MKSRNPLTVAIRLLNTHAGRIVAVAILAVSTAIGCGWSMLTEHSVRFSSMRGRAFYRLPPLPIEYDPSTGKERTQAEVQNYDDYDRVPYEEQQAAYARPEKIWDKAIAANEAGSLLELRKNLVEFLEETRYGSTGGTDSEQDQRNVASDVLDAISEQTKGASDGAVIEYVKTRIGIQEGTVSIDSVLSTDDQSVASVSESDRARLGDNWAYLQAASLYASGRKDEARVSFEEHSARFPRSEKNEAALYMVGRIALEKSHSLAEERCGIQGENWRGENLAPSEIEDPNKCRDEHWQEAVDRFRSLRSKYPRGRYTKDASGWLAFLYKRGGERAEALAEYYRLLGQTTDPKWRLEAKKSLQIIGHNYDDATLDNVEALIANEPDAALAYAYHRIYNYAVDCTYEEFQAWCCYGEDTWSEKEKETARVKTQEEKGEHELERVAKFSTAMVNRYGAKRVSGDFLLRIAQAQLELQNFRDALAFADKSIAAGVAGDSRVEALWVKGSSEHRMKKLAAARTTFTKLIAEFPKHKLTEGARRLLAMTAEDQDDLEGALDIYFDLGYEQDIAYFVDVLFPTDRLAKYVAGRTSNPNHPILLYSLGVRYMRDGRWNEARDTLGRVKTEKGRDDYLDNDRHPTRFYPKEPSYSYGEKVTHIKTSWVMQDLKTVDIIEYHEKQVRAAQGDEAHAEAMYQLANAYFELDDLAFYNPAIWDGGRTGSLWEVQFSEHERLPNETRTIFDHLQTHDPWAKAIPMYEEIVSKYPESKVASDALYTVAVAHEKLEGRNSVWSEIYRRGLFAGPRKVTYADVKNLFPNYQLPRGTYGWKPSTRTVNGGPGWAPKPKLLPRLTTEQRVIRKAEKWADKYGATVWDKAVAMKNGIRDAAFYVSGAIAGYLQNYYYLVFTGFLATIFWSNRKEIYEGPVTKGSFLAHRGLVFLGKYIRDWWVAVAVPSVIPIKPDGPSDSGPTPDIKK